MSNPSLSERFSRFGVATTEFGEAGLLIGNYPVPIKRELAENLVVGMEAGVFKKDDLKPQLLDQLSGAGPRPGAMVFKR